MMEWEGMARLEERCRTHDLYSTGMICQRQKGEARYHVRGD